MLENQSLLAEGSLLVGSYINHFNGFREVYDRVLVNNHYESLVICSSEIKSNFKIVCSIRFLLIFIFLLSYFEIVSLKKKEDAQSYISNAQHRTN